MVKKKIEKVMMISDKKKEKAKGKGKGKGDKLSSLNELSSSNEIR